MGKIKYILFNRRAIGKFENDKIYIRDVEKHVWEYNNYLTCDYLFDHEYIEEEIDYDENTEEILELRRSEGFWASEVAIEKCNPSPQVISFLDKTGLTYEDIYGGYGKRGVTPSERKESLLELYPDLIEGAPGQRSD